jgi:hypothetical protein
MCNYGPVLTHTYPTILNKNLVVTLPDRRCLNVAKGLPDNINIWQGLRIIPYYLGYALYISLKTTTTINKYDERFEKTFRDVYSCDKFRRRLFLKVGSVNNYFERRKDPPAGRKVSNWRTTCDPRSASCTALVNTWHWTAPRFSRAVLFGVSLKHW